MIVLYQFARRQNFLDLRSTIYSFGSDTYTYRTSIKRTPHTLNPLQQNYSKSKLDYGATIYLTASPSLIETLEPVQNACLRFILKAFPSSPIHSLQALTGTPLLSTPRLLQTAYYSINDVSRKNQSHLPTDYLQNTNLTYPRNLKSCIK